mmetsp:Transcript_54650/g.125502  ORF Transcript_54650/g.125502 Transcript_54650/m.125502 type:complete len:216 (-) Transcript_54650:118-765(-)
MYLGCSGLHRPVYTSSTGRTGAPATKAPRLNGIKSCSFDRVPSGKMASGCIPCFQSAACCLMPATVASRDSLLSRSTRRVPMSIASLPITGTFKISTFATNRGNPRYANNTSGSTSDKWLLTMNGVDRISAALPSGPTSNLICGAIPLKKSQAENPKVKARESASVALGFIFFFNETSSWPTAQPENQQPPPIRFKGNLGKDNTRCQVPRFTFLG